MRKGLLLSVLLLSSGCVSTPRQGIQQQGPEVSEEVQTIWAEIQRYHNWLESRHRLLSPMPYYKGRMKPRQLDPDTLEPLPDPPPPTQEEIIKKLNEMLKDPEFRKYLEEQRKNPDNPVEMPAGARPQRPTRGLGFGRLAQDKVTNPCLVF